MAARSWGMRGRSPGHRHRRARTGPARARYGWLWPGYRGLLCVSDPEEDRDQRKHNDRHGEDQARRNRACQRRDYANADHRQRVSAEPADEIAREHFGTPVLRRDLVHQQRLPRYPSPEASPQQAVATIRIVIEPVICAHTTRTTLGSISTRAQSMETQLESACVA